jgi:hypothetical protein
MPESRHRTTIEVKAESKDIKNLGKELERTFDPRHIEAFEKALSRSTDTIGKLMQVQSKLATKLEKMSKDTRETPAQRAEKQRAAIKKREAAREKQKQKEADKRPGWKTIAAGTYVGTRLAQRGGGGLAGMVGGEGAIEAGLGMMPIVGPVMAATLQRAKQLYQYRVAERTQISQAFGATGLTEMGGFRDVAAGLGIAGPQAAAMMGGFGQRGRMQGRALRQEAPELLRAQQFFGIDLASMMGAGRAAGGRTQGARKELETGIAAGFRSGFRASEMPRFFQDMSGTLTSLREQGIAFTSEGMQSLAAFFGQRGILGGAAMRAAQAAAGGGLVGQMEQESLGGMLGHFAALRALRKAKAQDSERYERYGLDRPGAMAFAESNPVAILRELEADPVFRNASKASKAMLWKQVLPNLSYNAAIDLAQGKDPSTIGQEPEEKAATYMAQRIAGGTAAAATTAHAAKLVNKRAEMGAKVEDAVQDIETAEIELTEALLPAVRGFAKNTSVATLQLIKDVKEANNALDMAGALMNFGKAMFTGKTVGEEAEEERKYQETKKKYEATDVPTQVRKRMKRERPDTPLSDLMKEDPQYVMKLYREERERIHPSIKKMPTPIGDSAKEKAANYMDNVAVNAGAAANELRKIGTEADAELSQ